MATASGSVTLDLPMEDMCDVPMPPMTFDRIDGLIDVVDATERDIGPLLGWCCGEPQPSWTDGAATEPRRTRAVRPGRLVD